MNVRAPEGAAVSDFWTVPSKEEEAASRRRALWGLAILAAAALLVVGLIVLLGGSSGGRSGSAGLGGGAATKSGSQPAAGTSTTQPGASTVTSSASSAPATATTTAGCPSAAPCVVGGDDGGVVAALNAFRVSHGAPAVAGATSAQAQQCALSQGDGPACAPHYAWQPVASRNGAKVISTIASRSDGAAWLLDPQMTSFSVGWAYQPGGAANPGQYECAIVKIG
jgi:hypothetical protein